LTVNSRRALNACCNMSNTCIPSVDIGKKAVLVVQAYFLPGFGMSSCNITTTVHQAHVSETITSDSLLLQTKGRCTFAASVLFTRLVQWCSVKFGARGNAGRWRDRRSRSEARRREAPECRGGGVWRGAP